MRAQRAYVPLTLDDRPNGLHGELHSYENAPPVPDPPEASC